MRGPTGTNKPLCLHVWKEGKVWRARWRHLQQHSWGSGNNYIAAKWLHLLLFSHFLSEMFLNPVTRLVMTLFASVCGMKTAYRRHSRWTSELSDFLSACHNCPQSFSFWVQRSLRVGVWRFRGGGFHCCIFDASPPSLCVSVCAHLVCQCGFARRCIHMCGFALQRRETSLTDSSVPCFSHDIYRM